MTVPLIIKRAKFSRPSGTWKDEDYDVLADGEVVGRILEEGSRFGPPELRWGWSITSIVPASGATHGHAPTREAVRASFGKSCGGTSRMSAYVSATAPNRTQSAHWQIVATGQQRKIASPIADLHSPLIPAALMIGHHFSISAF
jgi:hypothetical protein